MKNPNKATFILITLSMWAMSSCAGYKVLDTWKAENAQAIRKNNILVVARTTNERTRMAFENEITNELTKQGVKATASYLKFPKLGPNTKMTEERKDSLRLLLIKEGFDGVALSVLKDYQENTRVIGSEGGYVETGRAYNPYTDGLNSGFYTYYYNPMAYPSDMVYVEKDTLATLTARNYVLQTSVYNLKLSEDKQLVAYLNASIENPENAEKAAKGYAKTLAKNFKERK
jgi:hypothetical protein